MNDTEKFVQDQLKDEFTKASSRMSSPAHAEGGERTKMNNRLLITAAAVILLLMFSAYGVFYSFNKQAAGIGTIENSGSPSCFTEDPVQPELTPSSITINSPDDTDASISSQTYLHINAFFDSIDNDAIVIHSQQELDKYYEILKSNDDREYSEYLKEETSKFTADFFQSSDLILLLNLKSKDSIGFILHSVAHYTNHMQINMRRKSPQDAYYNDAWYIHIFLTVKKGATNDQLVNVTYTTDPIVPTVKPTAARTAETTAKPTSVRTSEPTVKPTGIPTGMPTDPPTEPTLKPSISPMPIVTYPPNYMGAMDFSASCIRTNGYVPSAVYPVVTVIHTRAEWENYYAAHKDIYDMSSFLASGSKYTAQYFQNYDLILVLKEEGSGSIRYEVTGVTSNTNNIAVKINRKKPNIGTCDMAEWHIVIEVKKSAVGSKPVNVTFTDVNVS